MKKSSKLNICRYRDLEELFTLTFEFTKQNIFQYGKLALICALPLMLCLAVLGFDLAISKLLNIFEILHQLKFETISFNFIADPINLLLSTLYILIISVMGALSYAFIKLYKDKTTIKGVKFTEVLSQSKSIFPWVLGFNLVVFLSLSVYIFFLQMLSPFVSISYVLFIWSFTLQILSLVYSISAQIFSWSTLYILFFVIVLLPILYVGFKLLIRFSLLLLYSVPLKLEEPNLNFKQRLVKCYELLEGEAFWSWIYIHLISIAAFFVAYVFSIPIYGFFLKMGLFEHPSIGLALSTFFKCFSYGLVVFLSGFTHLAISFSFYSLYAKIKEDTNAKNKPIISEAISYPIHENGI